MSAAAQGLGKSRLPFWTGALISTACLAMLAFSALNQWQSRRSDLRTAEIEMRNLARSSTVFADDVIDLAETLVGALVYRMEASGSGESQAIKLRGYLAQRNFNSNRIRGLFVYDNEGRWLATSEQVDTSRFNNSDRDYFKHHRGSDDRRSFFGVPIRSKSGGQWIITISRRFNLPDGAFGGVVLATIDVAAFVRFFDQFDIGPRGAISLLTSKGIMLARSRDRVGEYAGRDMSNTVLFTDQQKLPSEDVLYFNSSIDGFDRLSYYERSQRYPFVVVATQTEDDVLSVWRKETVTRLSIVLGLIVLIGFTGKYLVSELARRQRMASALAAREADFRLLAEQSSDMVMRIRTNASIEYASPSTEKILGWPAGRLQNTPALAGIHPDDIALVERAVAELQNGQEKEARIVYRARHRTKGHIWLETALRATRSSKTDLVDGAVAISRDVTKQRLLETELEALATTDGLTGLGNRREFDKKLEQEWRRARREQTSLSLLMIDVDHFKKFNDTYGHIKGDDCLQQIGRLLSSQTKRPSDLAVRYGGEEFAVILPNTDADGCAKFAEDLRAGIESLCIAHSAHPSSAVVTISVGGAAMIPGKHHTQAEHLIAADRALYDAKQTRNRVVVTAETVPLMLESA